MSRRLLTPTLVALFFLCCVGDLLVSHQGEAFAAERRIHILVIEAAKKPKGFDPRILGSVRKHLESVGHEGAQVLDELDASLSEVGSRIQLEILSGSGKPRTLRVTLLAASAGESRLRLEIPEFKFDTSTKQQESSTVALAFRTDENKLLYLAVTPHL